MKQNFMHINNSIIKACSEVFLRHPRYSIADMAIQKVVEGMPNNTSLPEVIAKVSIIKSLYVTPFYDVMSLSEHIINNSGFDLYLDSGNPKSVEIVRSGHGIRLKKTGKEIDLYSFATKYCSFHNPEAYPIFYGFVGDLLFRLNLQYGWISKLYKYELNDYSKFKNLLDCFVNYFEIGLHGYKMLDQGIWVFAKYQWVMNNSVTSKDDAWLVKEVQRVIRTVNE
jgi:hypothetical protein